MSHSWNFSSQQSSQAHPDATPTKRDTMDASTADDTARSFTPAGVPSTDLFESSIMRSPTSNYRRSGPGSIAPTSRSGKNSFSPFSVLSGANAKARFDRAKGGACSVQGRGPSRLSKQYALHDFTAEEDEDDDEDEERDDGDNGQPQPTSNPPAPVTFSVPTDDNEDDEDDYDDDDDYEDEDEDEDGDDDEEEDEEEEEEEEEEDNYVGKGPVRLGQGLSQHQGYLDQSQDHDLFLDEAMRDIPSLAVPHFFDEDQAILATAASHANMRIMKEAENLYEASTKLGNTNAITDMVFARTAKEVHKNAQLATVTESDSVILQTEELLARLYDEGVGTVDDPAKLQMAFEKTSGLLLDVWTRYRDTLDAYATESTPAIGPGTQADNFSKARWLSTLLFRLRLYNVHLPQDAMARDLRYQSGSLFTSLAQWIKEEYGDIPYAQLLAIERMRPAPSSHTLYWSYVLNVLARGMVSEAISMLQKGKWDQARTGGVHSEPLYTGEALSSIDTAVRTFTIETLQKCPGKHGDFNIWSSEWAFYRTQVKKARDELTSFAEGKTGLGSMSASVYDPSQSRISTRAREAETKVPWDVYRYLLAIFDVLLGAEAAILEASTNWCDASIALALWVDEFAAETGVNRRLNGGLDQDLSRFVRCFHIATEDFPVNAMNPDELTYACAFEANYEGVVAGLKMWSLPIASAVAEIGSLAGWLPPSEPSNLITMDALKVEDRELLGVDWEPQEESEGIKDATLVEYAKELSKRGELRGDIGGHEGVRDGWEVAIEILGRMDSRAKSEDMVKGLLNSVMDNLGVDSSDTVDRIWSMLTELGMMKFAEEIAETYADNLSKETHRYGEALWYYALAHRPDKVREVVNLMISYSLMYSTVFPASKDLDDRLRPLLVQRSETLEKLAVLDLEAAELLGQMLAGYATLRKFYELRDGTEKPEPNLRDGHGRILTRRQQAAAALTAVIASGDDNIRGGLYDASRNAVVSEDFLLALLGEALVFLPPSTTGPFVHGPSDLSIDQINTLFKAVEDIETVGLRVFETAEEFFNTTLTSSTASNPKSQTKSRTLRAGGRTSATHVLSQSSIFASQLHKSFHTAMGAGKAKKIERGWDWRSELSPGMGAYDVLKMIRLRLSREIARLWVDQADNIML